jgi:hypothetical protein
MPLDYDTLMMYREEDGGYDDVKWWGLGIGIAAATSPIWLPTVAASGAAYIASHKVGLTIGLLISGVRGLKARKAPKEIAKDMIKDAAISTLVAAPLEDEVTQGLKGVQALINCN